MMGTVFKVNVKWQKEKFQDVELDTSEPPIVFKSQLFALTGVEPDRQKVMVAGKTIEDNTDWSTVKLKQGLLIMMMGTKEENALPPPPKEAVKFVEDMDMDQAPSVYKPGLVNLGNTCYLNATLQCLRTVPELHEALVSYNQPAGMDGSSNIASAAAKLWKDLDKPQASVTPMQFVATLKQVFPRFATRDDHGHPQQQDAQECWIELLNCLGQKLPGKSSQSGKSLIQQYFSIDTLSKISCPEAPEEPEKTEAENMLLLSCNISQETNHMHAGIKLQLNGTLEKFSPTLDRNAIYNKQSLIARLPAYLSVQYVRFYWKAASKTNAKVLRNVKFPITLDMYEFCTEELKNKLTPMRKRFEAQAQKEVDDRAKLKDLEKADGHVEAKVKLPYEFEDDPGSNNSGYYELAAVLTHKGRSSDSGHYVGWVRNPEKKGEWLQYDDDKVSPVDEEKVLQLSGGGDWHMAYILLYAPKVLEESQSSTE